MDNEPALGRSRAAASLEGSALVLIAVAMRLARVGRERASVRNRLYAQGNRIWNSAATLAGFCVSGEIDLPGRE